MSKTNTPTPAELSTQHLRETAYVFKVKVACVCWNVTYTYIYLSKLSAASFDWKSCAYSRSWCCVITITYITDQILKHGHSKVSYPWLMHPSACCTKLCMNRKSPQSSVHVHHIFYNIYYVSCFNKSKQFDCKFLGICYKVNALCYSMGDSFSVSLMVRYITVMLDRSKAVKTDCKIITTLWSLLRALDKAERGYSSPLNTVCLTFLDGQA